MEEKEQVKQKLEPLALSRSGKITRYTHLITNCVELAERLDEAEDLEMKVYLNNVSLKLVGALEKELKKAQDE